MRFAHILAFLITALIPNCDLFALDMPCPPGKFGQKPAPQVIYSFEFDQDSNGGYWYTLFIDARFAEKPLDKLFLVQGEDEDLQFAAQLSTSLTKNGQLKADFLVTSKDVAPPYHLIAIFAVHETFCGDPEARYLKIQLPPNNALH